MRERFLHAGEDPAVALAPGSPRRRALDAGARRARARARKHPSTAWRREFSLLLGLERVLSEEEPKLADGTVLSRAPGRRAVGHARRRCWPRRSGRNGNGNGAAAAASPELLASAAILGADDELGDGRSARQRRGTSTTAARRRRTGRRRRARGEDDEEDRRTTTRTTRTRTTTTSSARSSAPPPTRTRTTTTTRTRTRTTRRSRRRGRGGGAGAEAEGEAEEEPRDWVDEDEDEESLAEQPEDPNAAKRFWFEHATGAGKTVAALGFVEASRTGGILILTHRRNLVDQFHGELRDRGYSKRISRPLLKGEDAANGPVTVETYQWFVRNAGASRAPTRS